ncbi:MAG: pilus assembly protein [Gammaproteobacteria bacterium]|nr:pilus assembly protein [Gammaproteobacteria bacterium]MCP5136858.1 pilus assembly protein [Gammaproteobacteria bacterium]
MEFPILAIPFLMALFAVIELGYSQFLNTVLDIGVDEAARQVRTGQVQVADDALGMFKRILCDRVGEVMGCDRLIIDVANFTTFNGVNAFAAPDINATQFTPGGAGDIVVARVAYPWTFSTPLIGDAMADWSGNLVSSAVFRNEPFEGPPR